MLVFDLACNVPIKFKHDVVYKSGVPFQPVAVNENFAPVSVCQRINVVRSVICQLHVSFLGKTLFTTDNLVCPETVYNVEPVNSAHHIRRVFPSMHCTTSIHLHFFYWKYGHGTSFPLPSLYLNLFPGIKSHLSPWTSKLNLYPRPSSPLGTSSSLTF